MREEGKTEVSSEMEGLYNRGRYSRGWENLKNIIDLVKEFEKGIREEEVWWVKKRKGKQEAIEVGLNPEAEEFKRSELPGKYITKILFGWDNNKFEDEYLKKLERS